VTATASRGGPGWRAGRRKGWRTVSGRAPEGPRRRMVSCGSLRVMLVMLPKHRLFTASHASICLGNFQSGRRRAYRIVPLSRVRVALLMPFVIHFREYPTTAHLPGMGTRAAPKYLYGMSIFPKKISEYHPCRSTLGEDWSPRHPTAVVRARRPAARGRTAALGVPPARVCRADLLL